MTVIISNGIIHPSSPKRAIPSYSSSKKRLQLNTDPVIPTTTASTSTTATTSTTVTPVPSMLTLQKIHNIILDLDETLISAIETEEFGKDPRLNNRFKQKGHLFTYHLLDRDYIIFERPGVQKFLDFVFKHFNVAVWTAASKDYAIFVIDKVVLQNRPERKLDFICYSDHCDESKAKTGCLKQLNKLFHLTHYNAFNTIIIDDNANVNRQKNHSIKIKAFSFSDEQAEMDKALQDIQNKLDKKIGKRSSVK